MAWVPSDWDKPEKAAEKITNFWRIMDLKDKVVISSMAGHAVIIKRVTFAFSSEKELGDIIQKESKQYIPFDINDVYLDFQKMGAGAKDKTADVLLVASKKTVVHELEDVLTKAGLGLSIVDVDAFALSNCFEFNYPELLDEPSYLIDIGAQQSIFCVYWRQQPVFFREVSFGGQQISNAIAKVLNMNKFEAEKVKVNGGNGLTEQQAGQISQELAKIFQSWALELQRLIGFYQTTVTDAELGKRLFLAGGGSLLPGLLSSFRTSLGIEVRYLDPWRKVGADSSKFDEQFLRQVGPQFVVPLGLALRALSV